MQIFYDALSHPTHAILAITRAPGSALTQLTAILCLALVLGMWARPALGQACSPNSITLTSQADVNNFQATYGPCTEVIAFLTIDDNADGSIDITDLTPLAGLTLIEALRIENNAALTSLVGLENVTSLSGLQIRNNDALASLDGLSGLTSVDDITIFIDGNAVLTNISALANLNGPVRSIIIINNEALASLDALGGITAVRVDLVIGNNALTSLTGLEGITGPLSGGLFISENPALTNLDQLVGITSVGYLTIGSNDVLTNLSGLSGITGALSLGLRIVSNPALTDLTGLEGITSVGNVLLIGDNDALTSLTGLDGITSVSDDLRIQDNAALTDIDALAGISSVGNDLTVAGNPVLSDCNCVLYDLLTTPGAIGGLVTISGNATGCASEAEVISQGPCTIASETIPPVCALAGVNDAPPFVFNVTAQDAGSGLAAVSALTTVNASIAADPFTAGTTDPVAVTGTQADPVEPVAFALKLVDQANNTATCSFSGPGLLVSPIFDCEDLEPSTVYQVGDLIPTPGTSDYGLLVGGFGSSTDGTCTVVPAEVTVGGDLALRLERTTLNITPIRQASSLSFSIGGYLGGECVLTVNGETIEVDDFRNVDGTTVGGATISVTGDDEEQRVTLTGAIANVEVGGESHLVDDVVVILPEVGDCTATTLTESAPYVGSDGAGRVDLTFSTPDGIEEIDFSLLDNLELASSRPAFDTETTGADGLPTYTYGAAPPEIDITLRQVDVGNENAGYFGIARSVCPGVEGDQLAVEFDPPLEFALHVPDRLELMGAWPNPTPGAATVGFALPEASDVRLAVYDAVGRRVATLADGRYEAGRHELRWDGRSGAGLRLASGLYLVRLEAGAQTRTSRLTVVR